MVVSRVTSVPDFTALAEEWSDLLTDSGQANVFLSHEWLLNWWDVYGAGGELFILTCRRTDTGALAGLLPLYRTREGLLPRVNVLRFIAGHSVGSDFLEPITLPNERQQIFHSLLEYLGNNQNDWDVIEFSSVELDSPFYTFLQNSGLELITSRPECIQRCPYVVLPDSWDELLKSVSKKVRQKVGYYRRALERNSPYEISRIIDSAALEEALECLIKIRKDRLESKGINFSKMSDCYRMFHKAVMKQFLDKGWLQLYFLQIQKKPVAFVYQFVFQGRVFFYQTGFDAGWSAQSVGFVLLGHVIENAIQEKNIFFEFLRGDEKYKYDWNISSVRKIIDVTVHANKIKSILHKFKYKCKMYILKNIKNIYNNIK